LIDKNLNKLLVDMFEINGKNIVITGACGLIGRMHVEAVASYGGNPIIIDLYEHDVEKLACEISKKFGVQASGYVVDITDEVQIRNNVNNIIDKYGKIDGLVNNAANNPKLESDIGENFSRLENFPLNIWDQDIAVGLTGAFLCAKHYGYQISKNPNGGSIVNISSDLGLIAPDQRLYYDNALIDNKQPVKPVTYSVVKTGIIGLTRYLSTYWIESGVRCNAMCPGGVENGQSNDFLKKVSSRIPMNRLAKADEYQGALLWMLSDASSYLNGAIIPIDGGRTAW
jgi:NAD(P)-dependent dehydrogenase (short-subunit alcohol dehydrogenase family)